MAKAMKMAMKWKCIRSAVTEAVTKFKMMLMIALNTWASLEYLFSLNSDLQKCILVRNILERKN